MLLFVVGIAAIIPLWFATNDISRRRAQVDGREFLFLALFTRLRQVRGRHRDRALRGVLVPLVGIAFGFDA